MGQILIGTETNFTDVAYGDDLCTRIYLDNDIVWERPPQYFFNAAVNPTHDTTFWTFGRTATYAATDTYLHFYGARSDANAWWEGKPMIIPAWAHYINVTMRRSTYWSYSYCGITLVDGETTVSSAAKYRGVINVDGHIGGYAGDVPNQSAPGKLYTLDISAVDKTKQYKIVMDLYAGTSSRIDMYWDNVYFSPYKPAGATDLTIY